MRALLIEGNSAVFAPQSRGLVIAGSAHSSNAAVMR
jgi:hypothetical protein